MARGQFLAFYLALISAFTFGESGYAQCYDGSTLFHATSSLTRTGGNAVYYDVGTYVTGDYADQWYSYVAYSESVGSTVIHSNAGEWSGEGESIGAAYSDQPSVQGAGTYSATSTHVTYADCYGYSDYPGDPVNASLTVNTPTISGFFSNNAFWNLGPSSSNPQSTLGGGTVYQSVALTFNSNCNPGDTCTDTPEWVPSPSNLNNQATLSSMSGSSVTLSAGSSQGTCQYDQALSANIAGFSAGSYTFAVDSPGSISLVQSSTASYSGGYLTYNYYIVDDVCSPSNGLPGIPLYEEFPSGVSVQNGSNWAAPSASTWPLSCTICWSGDYYFVDYIGSYGAGKSPAPLYDVSSAPYPYNTVYLSGTHYFFSGTTTSGGGWQVYNGTILYYLDHGINNP